MKDIHFQILKEYLDELIINNGMIRVDNPERMIDKVKIEFLVKLAFRFYSKLYRTNITRTHRNKWKWFRCINCTDPCDDYKESISSKKSELPEPCAKDQDTSAEMKCLNCGTLFHSQRPDEEHAEYTFLPICPKCKKMIGEEIEIWQRLFD